MTGVQTCALPIFFKTNYIPFDGKDIELGFENDEKFPNDFMRQETYPINFKS